MADHYWHSPEYLVDYEIKAELAIATGDRHAELQAELDRRRAWRRMPTPPEEMTSDELAVEALRLWHHDPARRPGRYFACVAEAERRLTVRRRRQGQEP